MGAIKKFPVNLFKRRLANIEAFKEDPLGTQADNFFYLVKKAKATTYGKTYSFKKILQEPDFVSAYKMFRKTVPLATYDDFKVWIRHARQGEKNVSWPGRVKMFSKSSGTTSDKSKFIPVTKRFLEKCHYAVGRDVFACYFKNYPDSKLFFGKTLSLGGSMREDEVNRANVCGDISAIIMKNLPLWAQLVRIPKKETALMEEWESKLARFVLETKDENVVLLTGVPSWVLVFLRKLEEETGKKVKELWPNLELFVYGGVSLRPYENQYRELCGPKMRYLETYNSAEGFYGVGDDPKKEDLLLMLDYDIFYEFIPLEIYGQENMRAYPLSKVELNKNYALVISTSAGLWRYIIGDTIKFTSLEPHRFIITGRTSSYINVFGEELMVDNANRAIAAASKKTQATILEYSVAPIYATKETAGGHEWLIEFINEPKDLEEFADILDQELQQTNSDYEAKRYKDITLKRLKLVKARTGLFKDWLITKKKLGGQNKIPRLMNERALFEEMLELNNSIGN
ncbi:MAG: GH3 auxin-responsive promoter family protein [Patescibacteria group bacterium]|jgi:hypothetical protein